MSNVERPPQLWSDFDGTAVETVSKANPRNWLKYPLAGLAGYVEFLRGVQAGGVEVAGIISRRPEIAPRRWATNRTIAQLGLSEFFSNPSQVLLVGSETAKAFHLSVESAFGTVGVIDDKPHKVGQALLKNLFVDAPKVAEHRDHNPIVLGVIAHEKSQEYVERLVDQADILVDVQRDGLRIEEVTGGGVSIVGRALNLRVVQLEPFTRQAGEHFASTMLMAPAA